jgi:hypothetical protein
MPAKLMEETLHTWRDAERVLKELNPLEPTYDAIRQVVIDLQAWYQRLSVTADPAAELMTECRAALASARATLMEVRGD